MKLFLKYAAATLLIIVLLLICYQASGGGLALMVRQERFNRIAGPLWGRHTIGQSFTAPENGLSGVALRFATYARLNEGFVFLQLTTDLGENIYTKRLSMDSINDNKYHYLTLPPQEGSKGKIYRLHLSSAQGTNENSVTVWYSAWDRYPGGQAIIDGNAVNGDLAFRIYRKLSWAEVSQRLIEMRPFPFHSIILWYVVIIAYVMGFSILMYCLFTPDDVR